jgi:hypothetical protein
LTIFSEKSLFEQGESSDSFYATGSSASIGSTPGAFSSALRDKTQIKVSLPVRSRIRMLPNSSSIYYFDFSQSQWIIPQNAVADMSGMASNFAVNTIADQPGDPGNSGSIFVEDDRWFDCHGNSIASGSLNIFRPTNPSRRQQKTEEESNIGDAVITNGRQATVHLTNDYPKSVQRNQDYDATVNQCFTLPISEPFLIEKVVFEVPFCMGRGWFEDKTAVTLMTASGPGYTLDGTQEMFQNQYVFHYNQGGPGITLSLSSQKNYGSGNIRDLICKGLITHDDDIDKQVKLIPMVSGGAGISLQFNDGDYDFFEWQVTLLGIDSSETNSIITRPATNQLTSSVQVKSVAEVSNGTRILQISNSPSPYDADTRINYVRNLISSEYISLAGYITGVDPFGRGMSGFSPSGGSIFGREHTTIGNDVIRGGLVKNPYYFESDAKRQQVIDYVTPLFTQDPQSAVAPSYMFLGSKSSSPYLVYPGEKLLLAATKTRPAVLSFSVNIDTATPNALEYGIGTVTSSSYLNNISDPNGHDVQLDAGTINITFYGSYVREGKKYVP